MENQYAMVKVDTVAGATDKSMDGKHCEVFSVHCETAAGQRIVQGLYMSQDTFAHCKQNVAVYITDHLWMLLSDHISDESSMFTPKFKVVPLWSDVWTGP